MQSTEKVTNQDIEKTTAQVGDAPAHQGGANRGASAGLGGQAPQIIMKVIDLRELGETNHNLEHIVTVFLRYFEDDRLRLFSTIFVYCKNSWYCVHGKYYVHFDVVRWHCGRCYDRDDFQRYFLIGLYNKILETSKVPSENEIESKILEFYKTHIRIEPNIRIQDPIIIYKILEATRTIWIVKLPKDC